MLSHPIIRQCANYHTPVNASPGEMTKMSKPDDALQDMLTVITKFRKKQNEFRSKKEITTFEREQQGVSIRMAIAKQLHAIINKEMDEGERE